MKQDFESKLESEQAEKEVLHQRLHSIYSNPDNNKEELAQVFQEFDNEIGHLKKEKQELQSQNQRIYNEYLDSLSQVDNNGDISKISEKSQAGFKTIQQIKQRLLKRIAVLEKAGQEKDNEIASIKKRDKLAHS